MGSSPFPTFLQAIADEDHPQPTEGNIIPSSSSGTIAPVLLFTLSLNDQVMADISDKSQDGPRGSSLLLDPVTEPHRLTGTT